MKNIAASLLFLMLVFGLGICLSAQTSLAESAASADSKDKKVQTGEKTRVEIPSREILQKRYPHLMKFLVKADLSASLPNDEGLSKLLGGTRAIRPNKEMWNTFLQAAVEDGLTNLRAFALFGLEAKRRGISIWTTGPDYDDALLRNHINVGLSLPADNVIVAVWKVTPSDAPTDHLMDVTMYFSKPYVSEFPEELMPAALKVGDAAPVDFALFGEKKIGYPMKAELFWDGDRLGFRKVKGVSGKKKGFMGFLQKVLFFLPDAVDSMTIEDQSGRMITEAIVNTIIEDFEKNPKYRMSISDTLNKADSGVQVLAPEAEAEIVLDSVE